MRSQLPHQKAAGSILDATCSHCFHPSLYEPRTQSAKDRRLVSSRFKLDRKVDESVKATKGQSEAVSTLKLVCSLNENSIGKSRTRENHLSMSRD
jgi:hypothetical protein